MEVRDVNLKDFDELVLVFGNLDIVGFGRYKGNLGNLESI